MSIIPIEKRSIIYYEELKKLYKENSMFNFIFLGVILTEKTFRKVMIGPDKRTLLKKLINEITDPEQKINDEIINSIIDLIFFIVSNKKLLNTFKKSCRCIK